MVLFLYKKKCERSLLYYIPPSIDNSIIVCSSQWIRMSQFLRSNNTKDTPITHCQVKTRKYFSVLRTVGERLLLFDFYRIHKINKI